MQLNFNNAVFVTGSAEIAENMPQVRPLRPFDDRAAAFLNGISALLRPVREYPDAATFGFWCRKAALMREKAEYPDCAERYGRGVVFHSTPSNVPVNFAFSFAAGLLAGNANIVRLPAKTFPQVDIICSAVNELLSGEFADMKPYICFVRYGQDEQLSDAFSSLCDMRVVWGGDRTIAEMRRSPLPARAGEITFADRHSAAVISAEAYLRSENRTSLIKDFYNDTYYTDQNACTSPRLIFWLGIDTQEAKADFWARVNAEVGERYELRPVQTVGKLHSLYKAAAELDIHEAEGSTPAAMRLIPEEISGSLMDYKYNSGFFFECDIASLEEIIPVCGRRCQTVSYYGLSRQEIEGFLENAAPHGIDRLVPVGKTMDFSLVWDGHDLIRELSRRITII